MGSCLTEVVVGGDLWEWIIFSKPVEGEYILDTGG